MLTRARSVEARQFEAAAHAGRPVLAGARRLEGGARYEALVADPEGVIRRMLDFCGLPFDPACLEPHKTARAVLTPSASQVRQPLHRSSARSALYGDKLDRLRQRLRDAGVPLE